MRRRAFTMLLGGTVATWPSIVGAQRTARVRRIGCLLFAPPASAAPRQLLDAFREGLRELGYIEGQNLAFELRSADGQIERFPELATDLVRQKVDLIATFSNAATHAARRATAVIPIVSFNLGDPVGEGLVASLAQPGGNITGYTIFAPELVPKALSILVQAVPKATRVAALWFPGSLTDRSGDDILRRAKITARTLGVELLVIHARSAEDLEGAFNVMTQNHAKALLVLPSPMTNTERASIARLALQHGLPAISWTREFVEEGGFLAYGSNLSENWRQGAIYADMILRGVKPADLPVQQPRAFQLVINARTAGALALAIPPTLLVSADEVIE